VTGDGTDQQKLRRRPTWKKIRASKTTKEAVEEGYGWEDDPVVQRWLLEEGYGWEDDPVAQRWLLEDATVGKRHEPPKRPIKRPQTRHELTKVHQRSHVSFLCVVRALQGLKEPYKRHYQLVLVLPLLLK
jgi:hypothetical protein